MTQKEADGGSNARPTVYKTTIEIRMPFRPSIRAGDARTLEFRFRVSIALCLEPGILKFANRLRGRDTTHSTKTQIGDHRSRVPRQIWRTAEYKWILELTLAEAFQKGDGPEPWRPGK